MMQMESKIHTPNATAPSTPESHPQFSFDESHFQGLASFDILGTASPATSSFIASVDPDPGHASSSSPEDHSWFETRGSRSGDSSSGFDSPSDGEGTGLNEAGLTPEFQEVLYVQSLISVPLSHHFFSFLGDLFGSIHAFISHRHQLAFQVDPNRLCASLTVPSPDIERAHPSLRNIVFALGCYFSRLSWLDMQEAHFVNQALRALQNGLSKGEQLMDIVQACGLLASYSFLKGNVVEINYHVACATRLATGLGLHQILASEYGIPWALNNMISVLSRDGLELVEAATVFWVRIFPASSVHNLTSIGGAENIRC